MTKKRTNEEKEHWSHIWLTAMNNMPCRIYTKQVEMWITCGELPVPLYIALSAKKNIQTVKGQRQRRVVTESEVVYGQMPLFLVLMGDFDGWGAHRVRGDIKHGRRPREKIRRKLLLELYNNGRAIAWDYLKSKGKDHLFTDDTPHTIEKFAILNPGKLKRGRRI